MGKIIGLTFGNAAGNSAAKGEQEKLVCPHCGKEYKSAEYLAKHIAEKHSAPAEPETPPAAAPAEPETGKDAEPEGAPETPEPGGGEGKD